MPASSAAKRHGGIPPVDVPGIRDWESMSLSCWHAFLGGTSRPCPRQRPRPTSRRFCCEKVTISCGLGAAAMAMASGSSASGAALASGGLALACAAPTRAHLAAPGCRRPRTHIASTALLKRGHLRLCLAKQWNRPTRTFLRHPHMVRQLSFAMSRQWHLTSN